jgi:hypothetical protein
MGGMAMQLQECSSLLIIEKTGEGGEKETATFI